MKLKGFFILAICGLSFFLEAQNFDFSINCELAYKQIIALKIDAGKRYLAKEQKNNPKNQIPILLYNYIDFLEVYTSNSVDLYNTKKSMFDLRLKEIRKSDSNSPYYLFAQGEIHLHKAVLHIKFGEYFAALMNVKKSLSKLEENYKKYPDFVPNYKSIGTLYTIFGSIPEKYQIGLSFIGIKGSINDGMNLLNKVVKDKNSIFQHESATIFAFLHLHITNNPEMAWKVLKENNFFNSNNLMDVYAVGHIGIHGGNNEEGLKVLLDRPLGSDYLEFPYLNFLIGLGKTYKQDKEANSYFQKFLSKNKGEDYIKSAWHKMAWNELINGNIDQYNVYLINVLNEGRSVIDTDKQAEKEANTTSAPHPILLKARLLSDGNYLSEAIYILDNQHVNSFEKVAEKVEYFYRYGRIYDKLKNMERAIEYYNLTIQNGKTIPFYFSANAAYAIGLLYENMGEYKQALDYYNLSLSLDGFEYQNSINQKAKAGINRIKS